VFWAKLFSENLFFKAYDIVEKLNGNVPFMFSEGAENYSYLNYLCSDASPLLLSNS